ncbi:uncharacterized protein LOC111399895 [Olea europaea var. sylvestris]|uniref:uncharacterized protein LOC111399895 n=1 Tax=Olea europaea var. sylvestris TaxID=158386 RepID=UPI000C1D0DDE|nr:uncharacterized protein LOC111399895 [Olea europaea var. sylvestris]
MAKSAPSRKRPASASPILEDDVDDDDDDVPLIVKRNKSSASPSKALALPTPAPSSSVEATSSKPVDDGTMLKGTSSVPDSSSQPMNEPPSSQGVDPPNHRSRR